MTRLLGIENHRKKWVLLQIPELKLVVQGPLVVCPLVFVYFTFVCMVLTQ